LLAEGNEVYCLDNFFTGQRRNIKHLLTNKNFTLIEHDIIDPFDPGERVDWIINFACPVSVISLQVDPIHTMKTSVHGVINMLELAKATKARVLQASTSEVYGDPEIHPQPETYRGSVNPIGPRACYDEGKRCAETLFFDYHREHQLPIKVARIFNTYGPNMSWDDGRVVSNFITQALRGEQLTVYGDGSQSRSFCYVSDLVEGLCKMMETDDFTGPVNLGNPQEDTVLSLAEKIISLTGSRSRIISKPLPQDDPKQRCPDITLAQEKLGWRPIVGLDAGLEKTIAYFKSVL